ncbi:MAG: hypothetical protein EAX89_09665 [Candidatus Lokiarchaeota archaeon]|nr:hypothetical protein [Candidatus Lokiarchaeota archaeon]
MRLNKLNHRRLFILLGLICVFIININYSNNNFFDALKTKDNSSNTLLDYNNLPLETQTLSPENEYYGIGQEWNVTHWANRTDNNLEATFQSTSYDVVNIPLGYGWQGYNLSASINDLYEKRNWANGTFNCGPDDNTSPNSDWSDNDSSYLQNWTFGKNDVVGYTNPMSGNYYDSGNAYTKYQDCLELRIRGGPSADPYGYDQGDNCWWSTDFQIPRGKAIEAELNIALYSYNNDEWGDQFNFQVLLNDKFIYGMGFYSLELLAGAQTWYPLKIQLTNWLNDPSVFSDPVNDTDINLKLRLYKTGGTDHWSEYETYYSLFLDNVSLILKSQALPTQLGLKLNSTAVQNINWGSGTIDLNGNWNGSENSLVNANFSCTNEWALGDYDVSFKTNLNLFTTKSYPETNYETNTMSIGTSFEAINNSNIVNWECYAYFGVPTGYQETLMKLEFPEDVNITWISNPQQPDTNVLSQCNNLTHGLLIVPVNSILSTPDGFWKFKGISPNYCTELKIYNNNTGSWVEDTNFFSGGYVNITSKVVNSALISSYIQNTKAKVQIRFPNGSIWSKQSQIKNLDINGNVKFDVFQIPLTPPEYMVGEYEVIVTWNNSYSINSFNEIGIISKKLTVIHESVLIPDKSYYEKVFEGTLLNLKVTFKDIKNNKPIEDAVVYLYNFTGGIQYFSEINPGYYFLEYNSSGGFSGNNIITIYGNSTYYQNFKVNITVELILETNLKVEEFPSLQVVWKNNFTVHLNYTEKITGNGIITSPQHNWIGDYHTIMVNPGVYYISFNSSLYEVNKFHSLIINLNETGFEQQTIIVEIQVLERSTYLDKIYLNDFERTSIEIAWNKILNITTNYKDINGLLISGAIIQLRDGTKILGTFSEQANKYYSLLINTTLFNVGVNSLAIYAKQTNYTASFTNLIITIGERSTYCLIFLDSEQTSSCEVPWNDNLNITAIYRDQETNNFIGGATLQLRYGSDILGTLSIHTSYDQYYLQINTTILSVGVNGLTIYAKQDNYSICLENLIITVIERETTSSIYLDNQIRDSYQLEWRNIMNITTIYKDLETSEFIDGALVQIRKGAITLGVFSKDSLQKQYTYIINTTLLGVGVNTLTIYAKQDNYSITVNNIIITVAERTTQLQVLLDGRDLNTIIRYNISMGEALNITAIYKDDLDQFIDGATVNLVGGTISEIFIRNLVYEQYNLIILAEDLGVGVTFLTISAKQINYSIVFSNLMINVKERKSDIQLFLNEENKTLEKYIKAEVNTLINITIIFRDYLNGSFISGATVQFVGTIEGFLTQHPVHEQYNVTIDSNNLGQGVNFLTIFAQKDGYESKSILITIEIIELKSILHLFLNEANKTLDKSIKVTIGQIINITTIYEDYLGNFVEGALVAIVGEGISENFTRHLVYNQYNLSLDSRNLNFGVNFLTIYAQKINYQPQTTIIKIEIVDKDTNINLFLNQLNKTLDSTIELPYGAILNITIKYFEVESKEHISNAMIQLIGEGLSEVLIEFGTLNQYSIIINTNQLDIGVRFLTIYAQKANYQSCSKLLKIQVNRIKTNVSTYSGISVFNKKPGDSFELEVLLMDLDFNQPVLNASVTYTWTFGQGSLLDQDDNGIYTATLTNLVEGIHVITITVYAGDDYEFERYRITLNVIQPAGEALLFQILTVVGIAAAVGIGGYLIAYQKVLKYPKQIRKIRKIKKTLKSKKLPKIEILPRKSEINEIYYLNYIASNKNLKDKITEKSVKEAEKLKKNNS